MRALAAFIALATGIAAAPSQSQPDLSPSQFREDFTVFVSKIKSTYAYFDLKATRWDDVPVLYEADLAQVRTRREFVLLLEQAIAELYDDHAHLTVNTATSPKLVPSGTDLWPEWRGTSATIAEVRQGSDAAGAGLQPGAVVIAFNGVAIADATNRAIGRAVPKDTLDARNWALRRVLAGRRGEARRIEVEQRGARRVVDLPAKGAPADANRVTFRRLDGDVGYVAFNDSLGNAATVGEFDRALAELRDTAGLIVDLRETPGGGNSTVARGILGRFVSREVPYQKHLLAAEERETAIRRSWVELVSPRGPFTYDRNVAVLVGRWTGSMGEGLAIGFDAVGRGTTVGGRMAQLLGATYRIELPNSKVGVMVPAERLYHVDGRPREAFEPSVPVKPVIGRDEVIEAGLRTIRERREP